MQISITLDEATDGAEIVASFLSWLASAKMTVKPTAPPVITEAMLYGEDFKPAPAAPSIPEKKTRRGRPPAVKAEPAKVEVPAEAPAKLDANVLAALKGEVIKFTHAHSHAAYAGILAKYGATKLNDLSEPKALALMKELVEYKAPVKSETPSGSQAGSQAVMDLM